MDPADFILQLITFTSKTSLIKWIRRYTIEKVLSNLSLILKLQGIPSSEIKPPSPLIQKIFRAKPDPLHHLGLRILQKDIGTDVIGLTTGRFIVIVDPELVKKHMGFILSEEAYKQIMKEYLKKIEKSLTSIGEIIFDNELLKVLTHEYYHWYIIRGTSTAALIDALSWMIRILQIVLTEYYQKLARKVLSTSLSVVKNCEKTRILEIARESLDIPIKHINTYFTESWLEEGEFDLAKYFYNRFMKLASNLDLCHLEVSGKEEKSFSTVWSYIFNSSSWINTTIIEIMSEILA